MNVKIEDTFQRVFPQRIQYFREYSSILISFFVSAGFFYIVRFLENQLYQVFVTEHYLVIHTMMEFVSIIIYIASFLVIYYVGNWDKRLRMKVLGGVLLFVGCIDFWHTFSYNGMPGLFVDSSVQLATSYWIIGRVGFSGGILVSSFIPIDIKIVKERKWLLSGLPFLASLFLFFLLSYYPGFFPTLVIEGQGLTGIKQGLEYIIIFMLLIAFINYIKEYHRTKSKELPLLLSALILSIFSELTFVSYFSVYDTYNLLGHAYKLIASFMLFKVLFIVNIHHPYNKLDRAEKEISKYANNLEQLVEQRTEEINEANKEMLRDLEYAKTIQKAIMPIKHERFGQLEVYSEYIPYEKVGGDFYGFEDLDEEHLVFYIGDVAGHGIPAAMMTIFMKQTIITEKVYQSGLREIYSPKEVLINLYQEYNKTDFPLEMYAVMIYGIYDKKNNRVVFSSAGLNTYPLVYRERGIVETLEHTGFPICKFDENYQPDFKNYVVPLKIGDKILFYTDGLIEVSSRKGEPFGEDRVRDIFSKKGHLPPKELSEAILDELNTFIQGVKLDDDVHYLIMEVK